ncbi:unnamed protein product [Penicillium nalgiovense]|nr:unnamed protein product [Penicillium nalgiovense]
MRSYDSRLILGLAKTGKLRCNAKLIYSILLPKQFTPSLSHFPYSLSLLLYPYLSRYYTMVFARRSIFRAATAAQSFRAAPVVRQSAQTLGRRFNSTSGSYHPGHKTSDLPWLAASAAVTVPMLFYLWPSGSEGHHDAHVDEHKEEHVKEGGEVEEASEEKPAEDSSEASPKEEKTGSEEKGEEKGEEKEEPEEKKEEPKEGDKEEKPKDDDSKENKEDKKDEFKEEEPKKDEPKEDAGKNENNDGESKN